MILEIIHKHKDYLCLLAVLLAVCIAFGIYVSDYYHTDPAAEDAMAAWMNLQ